MRFVELVTLKSLWLDQNRLDELLESFGELRSLEILGLHQNRLTVLPESFPQLNSLQEVAPTGANSLRSNLGLVEVRSKIMMIYRCAT